MNRFIIPLLPLFALLFLFQTAHAHGPGRGDGWGHDSKYGRLYDPKTVTTVSGEVVKVELFAPAKGMRRGVHLQLKSGEETVAVHLGPSTFVETQEMKILEKDMVEVTGSKVTFDGKPAIIAASVKKGDKTLTLRDEQGIPVWGGRRMR